MTPNWLHDRLELGRTQGFRLLASFGSIFDATLQSCIEGVQSSMPSYAARSALASLGRDRRIFRGPLQTHEDYADQLARWIRYHQQAGNAWSVAANLQRYLGPDGPMIRVVNRTGFWTTLNTDGTLEFTHGAAWNWDSETHPERTGNFDIWIIVYEPSLAKAGTWGDGAADYWGDGKVFGHDTSAANARAIQKLIAQWKGAAPHVRSIIFSRAGAFDPADSGSYPTDGLWGNWSKLVGGIQVPSRSADAHYWDTP